MQTTDELIINYVKSTDLSETLRYVADDLIGLDNVKQLMLFVGGGHLYIPQPDKFKVQAMVRHFKQNPESSIYKLSRDFGLCSKVIGRELKKLG